eukprot:scaffold32692_cov68-Phaeocystis_antarctica.AAC.2
MQGTEAPTAPPYEPGSGAPSTPPYSPGGSSGDTCPTNSRCALPAPTHPTAPHRSIKQAQKGAPLAARRAAVRRDPRTLTLLPRPAATPRDDGAAAAQARVDRRGGAALLQAAPDPA